MAIVSCPECQKKLKVADTSIGKKVKCSCGNIFVAQESAAAVTPAVEPTPEKVFVSCTECGAKLKVGTGSLGKKMKCPKCAAVFVANLPEEAPPPMPKAPVPPTIDEDEDAPVKAKAKAKAKDDEDDLFAFAQSESGGEDKDESLSGLDDDAPPPPKVKAVTKVDDDDDEEEAPKAKPKAKKLDDDDDDDDKPKSKGKKPPPPSSGKKDEPLKYPSRILVNLLVFLMLLGFIGAFAGVLFVERKMLVDYGWPAEGKIEKPRKGPNPQVNNKKGGEEDKNKVGDREKTERDWLTEYRKTPPKEKFVSAELAHEAGVSAFAFAPTSASLVTVAGSSEKEGVKIWDLKDRTSKAIDVAIPTNRAVAAVSPSGELLAIGRDKDKEGKELEVKVLKTDGSEVKSLTWPSEIPLNKEPMALRFTSDGKFLTLLVRDQAKGFEARSWDTTDWKEKQIDVQAKFGHAFFSHSGDLLYECANPGGVITIREIATDKTRTVQLKTTANWEDRATPDDKYYLNTKGGSASNELQLVKLEDGSSEKLGQENADVSRVQFSKDGKYLLYTVANATVKLIDLESKKQVWTAPSSATTYAFSPGGVFVARSEKSGVQLLAIDDLNSGKP